MKKEELTEIKVKTDLPCNEINAKTSASSCWMMGIFFLGLKRKAHHPREATLVHKNEFYIEKTQNKLQTPVGAYLVSAQNAITLISLVITIILLLILAGITISLTLGENGIFGLAEKSVEKQKMAEYQEKIELSRSKVLAKKEGTITLDDLINQIYEDDIVLEGNINKIDEEKARLITSEGHEFIITTTNTEYVGINGVSTVVITQKIQSIEGDYLNILVTIEDKEHGICEIVKPDGVVIAGNNKTKIAIDYKVEEGKDYIFKITNGEGKVKDGVVNVKIDLGVPQIKVANITPSGFIVIVDEEYPEGLVTEYKYYLDGNIVSNEIKENSYRIDSLNEGTKYNVYVEIYTKNEIIKTNVVEVTTETVSGGIKLNGNAEIVTNLTQSDIFKTANDEYTIAMRVKINRQEQATMNYMGLWGYHYDPNGTTCQFGGTGTTLVMNGINTDYTPYYDKWTDITATYKNGNAKVYFNSKLMGTVNINITPYSSFVIGNSYVETIGNRKMKGEISSVKVWSKELTEDEVVSLDMGEKNTGIQKEYIKLETGLESLDEIQRIGTIVGAAYSFLGN